MVQIIWLKSARNDLKDIYDFIAIDSNRYAKLQVEKIQLNTEILKSNIELGRVVPELSDPCIREIFERNYRIIYRIINPSTIHIIFIHHSARQFPRV
jgi:toxin ParE1/3/4